MIALCGWVFAPAVNASTITVTPAGNPSVVANTTTGAPGFGSSSFEYANTAADNKAEVYIAASSLFSHAVTVGDLASVSYWTNKPGDSNTVDWSFYIYTALSGSNGNSGGFYGTRLTSEPIYSNADPVAANTWHQWQSGDANAPMRFYDAARDGGVLGTNSDPTFAQIASGTVTWGNNNTVDYRNEIISLFSLQTGSAWSNDFLGLVDGLTIALKDGEVATVDFSAAVPEPPTWAMIILGFCGIGFTAYRRRNQRSAFRAA